MHVYSSPQKWSINEQTCSFLEYSKSFEVNLGFIITYPIAYV